VIASSDVKSNRSKKYRKSVLYSLILQFIGILLSLAIFPLTVNYLGIEEFGVWSTVNNLIIFLTLLDFGLSHGLRNKYAEYKVINDNLSIKGYISSCFFSLLFISIIIFLTFLIINPYVDWLIFLNAPLYLKEEINILIFALIITFCTRLVFSLINSVLFAEQNTYAPLIATVFGNFLSVIFLFWIGKLTNPDLVLCGIILFTCQTIPIVLLFFYYFLFSLSSFFPNYRYFSYKYSKEVIRIGIGFFFIQLTSLVLYQSTNLIIAHTSNYSIVGDFNVSFKYLSILNLGFSTILAPMWSACTDAFFRNDLNWISRTIKKLNYFWFGLILSGLLMILSSSYVYQLVIGNKVQPDYSILGLLLVYFVFLSRVSIYRSFMNGVGKIKIQIVVTSIQAFLHIPLSYLLSSIFGIQGILFVMILWVVMNSFIEKRQFRLIIEGKARGIWYQ
jgi:O-antigen/teichoic acid export membrane protein